MTSRARTGRTAVRLAAAVLLAAALAPGCRREAAPTSAPVQVRQEPLTYPYDVLRFEPPQEGTPPGPVSRPLAGAGRGRPVMVRTGERTFESVILENEFVRVTVLPGHGGVVESAQFKPTGQEFFAREKRYKMLWPYWESGVKMSFPFHEHGGVLIDQPASFRILRRADGSATVAMWMEFSRFNYAAEPLWRDLRGQPMLLPAPHSTPRQLYSSMFLSQHVTLRPGEALFRVTYRLENPTPFRQGRKVWNDAFFPRVETREGVVQGSAAPPEGPQGTELILPAADLSGHFGAAFRPWDRLEEVLDMVEAQDTSLFAWAIPYGFAGLWYPDVRVSRLRLFDPDVSPGTKVYFYGFGLWSPDSVRPNLSNFVELWGGADDLFEATENWIGPGEAWSFTHAFALVPGIGKVDYADERAAVHVGFGGDRPCLEAVPLRPVEALEARLDGRRLGRAPAGPDRPARFALPPEATRGRLTLRADGRTILDQAFPLPLRARTDRYARIRAALANTPENIEMSNAGRNYGRAIYREALRGYPEGSLGRGRVLYRDGQFEAAAACLARTTASDPDDGEAWHLLGTSRLVLGRIDQAAEAFHRAVAAGRPYPPARYFLALDAVARGDADAAARHLADLLREVPSHWEARLLAAWVLTARPKTRAEARREAEALAAEDPADPRAAYVLLNAVRAAGEGSPQPSPGTSAPSVEEAKAAFDALMAEPGAARRMEEFRAATQGRLLPHMRIGGG